MTHARQVIRSRVETRLQGLTSTGTRVFAAKTTNLQGFELPCLLFYTLDEEIQPDTTMGTPFLTRFLSLTIEGVVQDGDTIFNALDQIAQEVEITMSTDRQFDGAAQDSYLTNTEVAFNGEGDQVTGSIKLTYQFVYRTAINSPTTNV